MSKFIAYFMLFLAVVLIIWGLSLFKAWKAKMALKKQEELKLKKIEEQKNNKLSLCPLCQSPLKKGEQLSSKVYRPMNVPQQYCTINGCPHCFPILEPGVKRICPVCKVDVPMKGYLVAHLFSYPNKKRHVLVTGCSEEMGHKNINLHG